MEKRWKSTIFNGKNVEHIFLIGKRWKIIIFNGKTMENHHF